MILPTVRTLIVAAAAVSTVFCVLWVPCADALSFGPTVHAVDGPTHDDLGTLAEAVESDDREEEQEEGWRIHLSAQTARGAPIATSIVRIPVADRRIAQEWPRSSLLVHGPPIRC